jgi:hypothetical protein
MLLCISSISKLSSQTGCGTIDPIVPVNFSQSILNHQSSSSSQTIVKIPVSFTIIRSSGNPNMATNFNPSQLLSGVNSYFNSSNCIPSTILQFYACDVSYVIDNTFNVVNSSSAAIGSSPYFKPNVLNVFLVEGIIGGGGYAFFPWDPTPGFVVLTSIYSNPNYLNYAVVAHELGHYFGLYHTHRDPYTQFVTYPKLYNGTLYTKYTGGDMIGDTEADPGPNNCGGPGCLVSPNPCINDAYGEQYKPDRGNIMSYYDACRNKFSCEQLEVMAGSLQLQSRSFLVDNSEPTCQTFQPLFSVPSIGIIERNCEYVVNSNTSTPIQGINSSNIEISVTEGTNTTSCTPDTYNGTYTISHSYCNINWTPTSTVRLKPNRFFTSALKGVSTFDLLVITKHLLDITPFVNPFQYIAADVNWSGTVTTFDVLKIRKVILGVDDDFTSNNGGPSVGNWRYLPKYCLDDPNFVTVFNNTSSFGNPLSAQWNSPSGLRGYASGTSSYMDEVEFGLSNPDYLKTSTWSFNGIKTGDVDCSANVGNFSGGGEGEVIATTTPHEQTVPTKYYMMKVKAKTDSKVAAYQIGFDFAQDSLQVLSVQAGSMPYFNTDNFGLTHLTEGELRTVWYQPDGSAIDVNGNILFQVKFKATKGIANIADRFKTKKGVLPTLFYDKQGNIIKDITLKYELVRVEGLENAANDRNVVEENGLKAIIVPNPSEGFAEVHFNLSNSTKVQLDIFDAVGRLVKKQTAFFSEGENTWNIDDFSSFPNGVYGFSISHGEQRFCGKIVKI